MPVHSFPRQRVDELRAALPTNVDLLYRRRAALVPEDHVDDYVALDWMKWDGGLLRLTTTGINIHRQMMEAVEA